MKTIPDSLIPWAPAGLTALLIELSCLSLDMQLTATPICKLDGTLVTPADTLLEDRLTAFLKTVDPQSYVIGEETLGQQGAVYLGAALSSRCWVLDPIDGTTLYALGIDGWGISVGLMEKGVLVEGVVAYPRRGVDGDSVQFLFSAGTGVRAAYSLLKNNEEGTCNALMANAKPLAIRPAIANYPGQIASSQRFAKAGLYKGKHPIICFASSVQSFNLLMSGALVAYLVKLKLWDLAAVWPMAWRMGIRACLADGRPVELGLDAAAWRLDPIDPQFLGLRDHILFYWPDRVSPAVWQDIQLPPV